MKRLKFVLFITLFIAGVAFLCGCGGKEGSVENKPESISKYLEKTEKTVEKYGNHPELLLWEDTASIPDYQEGDTIPTLTPYLCTGGANAMIIVSGGLEGDEQAEIEEAVEYFNGLGFQAFVLKYRTSVDNPDAEGTPDFMRGRQDVARAIRFVRAYEKEFQVRFIGAAGFELGAELLMLNGDASLPFTEVDDVDKEKTVPDFQVLGNPSRRTAEWPLFDSNYPFSFVYYPVGGPNAKELLEEAETVILPAGVHFEIHGFMADSESVTGLGGNDAMFSRVKDALSAWLEFNNFK